MVLYLFVGFDDDYTLINTTLLIKFVRKACKRKQKTQFRSGSDHCICEYRFIFSVDVGNNFTDIFPSTDLLGFCGKARKMAKLNMATIVWFGFFKTEFFMKIKKEDKYTFYYI